MWSCQRPSWCWLKHPYYCKLHWLVARLITLITEGKLQSQKFTLESIIIIKFSLTWGTWERTFPGRKLRNEYVPTIQGAIFKQGTVWFSLIIQKSWELNFKSFWYKRVEWTQQTRLRCRSRWRGRHLDWRIIHQPDLNEKVTSISLATDQRSIC